MMPKKPRQRAENHIHDLIDSGLEFDFIAERLAVDVSTVFHARKRTRPPMPECDGCGCVPTYNRSTVIGPLVLCTPCHRRLALDATLAHKTFPDVYPEVSK